MINLLEHLRRRGEDAVYQALHRAFDGRQRRAKFMRHIANQTLTQRFGFFQTLRHEIETPRQLRQLVRFPLGDADPLFVMSICNQTAHNRQLTQRGDDFSTEDKTHRQRGSQRRHRRQREGFMKRIPKTLVKRRAREDRRIASIETKPRALCRAFWLCSPLLLHFCKMTLERGGNRQFHRQKENRAADKEDGKIGEK